MRNAERFGKRPASAGNLFGRLASVRTASVSRLVIYAALFMMILMINVAVALAQVQSHRLSELRIIDVNLDMTGYNVTNVSRLGVGGGAGAKAPGIPFVVDIISGPAAKMGSSATSSTGNFSVAMGDGTVASGNHSLALGQGTTASGEQSVAFGQWGTASGENSLAGGTSEASGPNAVALGSSSQSSGQSSFAAGYSASASNWSAVAMGHQSVASGMYSTAIGINARATNTSAVALGGDPVYATGYGAVALGRSNSGGTYSTSMGYGTVAEGEYSTAMGYYTNASGAHSFAIGNMTNARGNYSTAMGYSTNAGGVVSTAAGYMTNASGGMSTALGILTIANGAFSTAMGGQTNAKGAYSTAMGFQTKAVGPYSTVMGQTAEAHGDSSVAMGYGTNASGANSVAMGAFTNASGIDSTALGYMTKAGGDYSIAIGRGIQVLGMNSVGIGLDGTAYTVSSGSTMAIMGGKVGIGTVKPEYLLHINGTGNERILLESNSTGGNVELNLKANGATWGMYHKASDHSLDFYYAGDRFVFSTGGVGTCSGGVGCWAVSSSRDLKENITELDEEDMENVLRQLIETPIYFFTYKNSSTAKLELGFIAQDSPDWITTNNRTAVGAAAIGSFAVTAIKAQQTRIERIEAENKELKQLVCLDHPEADVCRQQ